MVAVSPRPRQATGRPGTPVIGVDWETAHVDVAARALRGRVTLTDPADTGEPAWVNDQWVAGPAEPYDTQVPARVQRLSAQTRTAVTAEDDEVIVDHLVQVHRGRDDVRAGHLVTVTTSDDAQLVGQTLRVEYVAVGTEAFSRDLFCTLT